MNGDLDARLTSWGLYFRWRDVHGQAYSLEGSWRSPQPWDAPPLTGWLELEVADAELIESAVCALDLYSHVLLKCWYVWRCNEDACLAAARRVEPVRRRRRREFRVYLGAAKALLATELGRPATVRKQRASAYVRELLGLAPLTAVPGMA